MSIRFDAVYEKGVLRPLQPLSLTEHEHVIVSIAKATNTPARSSLDIDYIQRLKQELHDEEPMPGLEEVRRRLSRIPGSMADEIVAARGDR